MPQPQPQCNQRQFTLSSYDDDIVHIVHFQQPQPAIFNSHYQPMPPPLQTTNYIQETHPPSSSHQMPPIRYQEPREFATAHAVIPTAPPPENRHNVAVQRYPSNADMSPDRVMQAIAPMQPDRDNFGRPSESQIPSHGDDDPVYVNRKQYQRIIKRRQQRQKQMEKFKANKRNESYLHESRHKHAMTRVRGKGGRFLKKGEEEDLSDEHP
jgi:nuclear transcription factor Y alpha